MDPLNFSIFKFEFIPHRNIFLFEMQNLTAAYSTFLIPIKKLIFQRLYSLSDISKRKGASGGHAPSFFFIQ